MRNNKIQVELTAIDKNMARTLRQGAGQIKEFDGKLARLGSSLRGLATGGGIGTIFAALGGARAMQTADTYTLLEGRLKLVTESAEQLAVVEKELYSLSQRTRTEYGGNVEVYTRLAQATKDLKLNQGQLLTITETLNKAFTVSGATEVERSSTMIQLSQAFSAGVLRGEEFNSVAEQGGRVMQLLADYTGKTRGELRKMAESGQITADVLTNAIFKGAADVDTEFAKMNRTVGQAGTVLANTLGSLVNDANKSSGATNGLSTAIVDLATTIDRNRDAILSLFANIVEAAQWAIERITNLSRTIRGIGMVKAGKLDLLEFAGMGPEDLEKWFSSFDSGTQKITSRLQSARAELAAMREGGNADRRQGLYQEIRELEFALEQAKEVAAAKKAAANNVKPVFSGGSVVPFSPTATKPASSAAAAERALNAEIAAGLRFREAQAELNADVFAEQVARLDRERQQYITTWADKAKTAEEKEKRITEIAAWYAASRAEIEQQAAQKAANDRRALLESGVALKEAELARQVAAGTITATEALAAQVDLLRQRQAILQEHLATMPKATAEDITAYNTQAAALAGVNAELAVTGTRLRLTNSFEALKQGLADIANSSAESGEAIRSALQSAFSGLDNTVANFVTGTKASFGDMVNSILADLARIASQKLISQPLAAGLSGMLSGISLNARGGVYRSVGLSAYSNSIVNQPTVFPFARGIGLMGEAGPEAILPLKRGPGGRLGVEASGSGGVVVNVIEAPGKGGQQQRRSDGGVNVVDVFVEQIKQSVATDIVRGSGQIPAALSWTYGLNRAAGAY